ncbi:MAG: hypothetical protein MHPSP_003068, partial [Paramarteilia canceri]
MASRDFKQYLRTTITYLDNTGYNLLTCSEQFLASVHDSEDSIIDRFTYILNYSTENDVEDYVSVRSIHCSLGLQIFYVILSNYRLRQQGVGQNIQANQILERWINFRSRLEKDIVFDVIIARFVNYLINFGQTMYDQSAFISSLNAQINDRTSNHQVLTRYGS